MSGIELKPLSESKFGRSNFLLPLGKTVIGRGPVLGVSDKRVSRNHGVVEVENGKLKIMSTHTNPTFYQAKGTPKLLPLPKEVWHVLEHGDRIALTPDQHVYEVVIDERHLHQSSQSLGSPISDSPVKQSPQKTPDEKNKDKDSQENTRQEERSPGPDEKIQSNSKNHGTKLGKEDGEEPREKEEDERRDEAKEDIEDPEDEELSSATNKTGTLKLPDGKEMALPLEKERKLPKWMTNLLPSTTSEDDKPKPKEPTKGRGRGRPRATGSTAATPKKAAPKRTRKPAVVSDEASEEEYQPEVKRTPGRGRGRPKGRGRGKGTGKSRPKRLHSDNEEEVEEDAKDEEVIKEEEENDDGEEGPRRWGHGKTRDQASVKRRAKLAMDYSEDFMVSEEEEEECEELPVPEGDDGSDWEPDSHSPRLARTPSKGRRTSGRTAGRTSGRKRVGGQRYSRQTSDDEDSDMSEEEVYIPRPTKRSGRAVSSSQEAESSEDMPKKRAKKTDNGEKKRENCQYGKKCYRKNPVHQEEFTHPGDSDYESPRSDNDDDDEKEDCPFGTDCYRKNKRHLEKYKHAPDPGRPKKQAAKKKAMVVDGASDDDGEENDHDDSLIADGTQGTAKDSESDNCTPAIKDDDN